MSKILNKTKSTVIAEQARTASSFMPRMLGLLNRSSLTPAEALIITRCQSIHMFFMRFPIDVVFVDQNDCVVGLVQDIKPNRLSPVFFRASYVIEGAVGMIERSKTDIGDFIAISD